MRNDADATATHDARSTGMPMFRELMKRLLEVPFRP